MKTDGCLLLTIKNSCPVSVVLTLLGVSLQAQFCGSFQEKWMSWKVKMLPFVLK